MQSAEFRFDKAAHAYFVSGQRVWSITQLLTLGGYVYDRNFTEAHAANGTAVHQLCADFDLGVVGESYEGAHAGFLQAYIALGKLAKWQWRHVEVGAASGQHGFAGTPDRVGEVLGALVVADIKTGSLPSYAGIQTALQAILVAPELHLPPHLVRRYIIHLKANGRYGLPEYKDPRDFDKAFGLIDRFCRA